MTFREEGTSPAGLARVLAEVGSLPTPLPLRRPGITALVPGATLLLRLCLCALVLHLQNVPSLRFSNLDRPGCLGEEGFFPWITGGPRVLGEDRPCPYVRPVSVWRGERTG